MLITKVQPRLTAAQRLELFEGLLRLLGLICYRYFSLNMRHSSSWFQYQFTDDRCCLFFTVHTLPEKQLSVTDQYLDITRQKMSRTGQKMAAETPWLLLPAFSTARLLSPPDWLSACWRCCDWLAGWEAIWLAGGCCALLSLIWFGWLVVIASSCELIWFASLSFSF